MINSVNILVGRLGATPELKQVGKGVSTCTLSIAENRRKKNENDEWCDLAHWHEIEAWGSMAERAFAILKKGSLGAFYYRIDYRMRKVKGSNGKPYQEKMPVFTLYNFDALANFGKRVEEGAEGNAIGAVGMPSQY